jgi:hypothetical protein
MKAITSSRDGKAAAFAATGLLAALVERRRIF